MERRDLALTVNGLRLRVIDWGAPAARPVVMLHGIRGYAETFATLAAALQPQFRVIAFDQRGRGDSDWDPARNYYTADYVDDLAKVAEQLELPEFDLLGHSMGGINAIVYASTHPRRVRRLVIEDAGPGAFEASAGATRIRGELESTPTSFPDWESAAEYMRRLRPTVTEAARAQRLHNMLKKLADGTYTWRHDHAGIAATRLAPDPSRVIDLVPHVRALRCPTLVLRGARSDYLQPEMAEAMTRDNALISWTEIPDAGHYIHDDQPALVSAAVREFLLQGAARKAGEIGDGEPAGPAA